MIIQTTKSFDKQYAKINVAHKQHFKDSLTMFTRNPFDPTLRNHALKGRYLGYRSIDITDDYSRSLCRQRRCRDYFWIYRDSQPALLVAVKSRVRSDRVENGLILPL